jgi:hypothetical protein
MRFEFEGRLRNYPDFLIVGAGKSGTTSLHEFLARHPDVVVPASKETLFFHIATNPNRSQLAFLPNACLDLDSYLANFDIANDRQICGESCPSYLYYYEHSIANIMRFHPCWEKLKIIIILREPVDKIVSHYFFVKNILSRTRPELSLETIEQSLELEESRLSNPNILPDQLYLNGTRYVRQVKAYLNVFSDTKILLFDDLVASPTKLYGELCEYLGLSMPSIPEVMHKKHNEGERQTRPVGMLGHVINCLASNKLTSYLNSHLPYSWKNRLWMATHVKEDVSSDTRGRLRTLFKNEVRDLGEITGIDLSRWGYGERLNNFQDGVPHAH